MPCPPPSLRPGRAERRLCAGALTAWCVLAVAGVQGQESPAPVVRTPVDAAAPAAAVPAPATVGDADIPPYHFSPLKLTGTVSRDGRVARLQAELEVFINHAAGWYDVPLRLTQGAIRDVRYSGPREPIPVQPTTQDDGVHWLFQGAGRHQLVLDLEVELRSTLNGTNLQLALPSGSRFFPAQLALQVPAGPLSVEAGKDNVVRTAAGQDGGTLLEATVDGNRLDVTWRVVPERKGMISRVVTSLALDRSNDALRLQAIQDLATDGLVSEVKVRLPEGFRLVGVGGRGYASHEETPATAPWVTVQLATPERGECQLEWTLMSESPVQGGALALSGFEVQDAVRQSGTIGVAPLPGYGVRRLIGDEPDVVEREEPRRLRATGGVSFYQSAWRFDRQPFDLQLALQELRPAFDVRTRAVATTQEDRLALELDYWVQVHAGQVRELYLRWPAPGIDQWSLLPTADGVDVTDATDEASQFPGELQRVTLPAGRDGEFHVRLAYQRPLTDRRFELALPQIVSERTLPGWLVVRGVDAVEPQLDAADGITPLVEAAADEWLQSIGFLTNRDRAVRVADPRQPVTGTTNVFAREFSARTVARVTRDGATRWLVRQGIQAEVKYGRLSTLALNWPPTFPEAARNAGAYAVRCRLESGEPLTIVDSAAQLVVALPTAVQGPVSLQLEYALPTASDPPARIEVPLFTVPESPFTSMVVEFPQSTAFRVTPTDAGWKLIPTALDASWTASAPTTAFAATLSFDVAGAPQRYDVASVLARVMFDPAGRSRVRVDYRVLRPPAALVLALPADAESPEFTWQGAPLSVVAAQTGRWELRLPDVVEANFGWLRVEYSRPPQAALDNWQSLTAEFPQLPEAVAVRETYVEIGLPTDYCLWSPPAGLTPQYEWQPGPIFQRTPTAAYLERRAALAPPAGSDGTGTFFASGGAGHVYAYWGSGPTAQVALRAIRLWVLILIGAGVTLAVAFLLWSWPLTRHVLTLLGLGFLVALAGVFAPAAVELLLQPMLLGLAAAVAAIGLQARSPAGADQPRRRRREEHSTRSEHPQPAGPGAPAAPVTTQLGPRGLQESGSRP